MAAITSALLKTSKTPRTGLAEAGPAEARYARTLRLFERRLTGSDLVATTTAVVAGLGFVAPANLGWSAAAFGSRGGLPLAAALVAGWMWALSLTRSRDRRVIGAGAQEFSRIAKATWGAFALFATVGFVLDLDPMRDSLAVAFVLGLAVLAAGRGASRLWLRAVRTRGGALASVLVVGNHENAFQLIRCFQKLSPVGYCAVGVCVPAGTRGPAFDILGVPVLGDPSRATDLARELDVDVVAVAGSDATTADYVRRLGWALNPDGIALMVSSALADVAGPRIITTPVAGARLVHVDAPEFHGPKYWVKSIGDAVFASVAVVLLFPVFAAIALAVRLDSPGPAFFKQVRIGRNGKPFRMYKFRSMCTDADTRLVDLVRQNDGNGLLFKLKADPRVTRVGRFLRRSSLDELPQLFNVAKGDMSLVGPRPPLEREVADYDAVIARRLLVMPGITGAWQVSGRSDLPLDESIRLDLNYVENWSLGGDVAILVKTVRAVTRGTGAY